MTDTQKGHSLVVPVSALKNQEGLIVVGMHMGRRGRPGRVLGLEQYEAPTGLRPISPHGDTIARGAGHVCPRIWEGDKGFDP
jgi:hypothetical protein